MDDRAADLLPSCDPSTGDALSYLTERYDSGSPNVGVMIEPLEPRHVLHMRDQGDIQQAQAFMAERIDAKYADELAAIGGFAALHDETVLGVAGVLEARPGVGLAWSLISASAGKHMRALTRRALGYLETLPFHRIEMIVDCDHKPGHRWARMLGMSCECERMRAWAPDGSDAALYAKVTPWK